MARNTRGSGCVSQPDMHDFFVSAGKQQAMRTAPWKDFRCEGCKREFTRRAFDRPKHCFNCEWLMSDACKLGDPRLAFAATSVQCAVPLQRQHSKDTP